MAAPAPPGPPRGLSDRDVSYLKLLKSLKGAGEASGGGDLGVVRRIAAWIDSPPILNYICAHQRWFDDWEVKEALLHNELTASRHRLELEKAVAIFDLLREMDAPGLAAAERAEIQDDLRYLFKQLPEHDRAIVKGRAYELSSTRRPKDELTASAAAPPLPAAEHPPGGDAPGGPTLLASEFEDFGRTGDNLLDGAITDRIRLAEDEAIARDAEVDGALAAAWDHAAAADARAEGEWLARELAVAEAERAAAEEAAREEAAREKARSEAPAREAALAPPRAAPAAEDSVAAPTDAAAPEEPVPDFDAEVVAEGAGRGALGLSVAQRAALAATTEDPNVLAVLAHDAAHDVQLALVGNPNLTDRHAANLARRATARVAEVIARERRLFAKPLVREAFLQSPNAPSSALLEIVNSITELPQLMRLLRNPKVRHLEVKAKARARLVMRFKALGAGEKLAAIRRSGSGLVRELWTDFFRDEALVVAYLQQGQVDGATVLEIARSRIAPRRALEILGTTPAHVANYEVRLQVVLNPKTPRHVVAQLVPKLSPADRAMIKKNPALPESVRQFA